MKRTGTPGKHLPRRKRLILRNTLAALAFLLLAGLWVLEWRKDSRPYRAGEEVEGITRSLSRNIPQDHPQVSFEDVADQAGIHFLHFAGMIRSTQLPEDMGSGAAWGDYDGDGDLDLYIANFVPPAPDPQKPAAGSGNRLYSNLGNGTFEDVTAKAGLEATATSMGAAWGDPDGDGDLDLVVTNFGLIQLFLNQGNGTFRDESSRLGPGNRPGFWAGASWGDYDNDQDLDLYVCGYVKYTFDAGKTTELTQQFAGLVPFTLNPSSYPAESNLLFQNRGHGEFVEVASEAGVANPSGRSLSAAWADFDLDGRIDLYVANDISDNVLYRNLGEGHFEDVSHNAWVADYRGAMGLAIGDWENDTDLDIFVTHWIAQENAIYNNMLFALGSRKSSPGLLFMDIADQVGLGHTALDYVGWGTSFFDYDNDGLDDLYVVNGSTFQDEKDPRSLVPMKDQLFWNRGEDKGFFDVGEVSGNPFRQERVGRGAAFADYDDDGDIDVLVVNHAGPAQLLQNEGGNRNNWIKIRIRAAGANSFGLGALVRIEAGGLRQMDEVGAQPSYLSQNAFEIHFGLGKSSRVDSVEVQLLDGRSWRRDNVAANQTLTAEIP